jgi:hypothetical protein
VDFDERLRCLTKKSGNSENGVWEIQHLGFFFFADIDRVENR